MRSRWRQTRVPVKPALSSVRSFSNLACTDSGDLDKGKKVKYWPLIGHYRSHDLHTGL